MRRALIAGLACTLLTLCGGAHADFEFALLGDTPYGVSEEASFLDMLQEINRHDVAFVVHVGDFKNGLTSCGDPVFAQRQAMFETSRHAFIYIPGDNEWTDCHRLFAGGYDPLERLAALRTRFFAGNNSLGRAPLKLIRQSDSAAAPDYPEHMRWQHDGILFVTLNMPGGDNNQRMPQESVARTGAALTWLHEAFALAREQKFQAVVVLMQANPFLLSGNVRRGYRELTGALARETAAFNGAVLLGHGDTHVHRIDHPLKHPDSGKALTNFTRAEVHGSPATNWLRVGVSRREGRVRFSISPGR